MIYRISSSAIIRFCAKASRSLLYDPRSKGIMFHKAEGIKKQKAGQFSSKLYELRRGTSFYHYFSLKTAEGHHLYYAHRNQREASFCVCSFFFLMSNFSSTNFLFQVLWSWLYTQIRQVKAFVFQELHLFLEGDSKNVPNP